MASKKFVKTRVKTNMVAANNPMRSKAPKRSKAPTSAKSGRATIWSGSCGAARFQPAGSGFSGSPTVPRLANACTMIATTVATMIPMRMPPGTPRATSVPMSTSAKMKTRVGSELMEPF